MRKWQRASDEQCHCNVTVQTRFTAFCSARVIASHIQFSTLTGWRVVVYDLASRRRGFAQIRALLCSCNAVNLKFHFFHLLGICRLGGVITECRTYDREVVGSTPGRVASSQVVITWMGGMSAD